MNSQIHDNGVSRDMQDPTVDRLIKALQAEKRRNAALTAQLRGSNRASVGQTQWIEEPSDDIHLEFMPRNSTMREDARGVNESSVLMTMSFASLQVPECKPMVGAQDVDRKTFEVWRDQFEAALRFAGVSGENMKHSAFRMKAGIKLLELLDETTSDDSIPDEQEFPYSNAIERLKKYYKSREYTLLQRQKLRSTSQLRGEDDMDYVKRVVGIVKMCGYPEEQELEMATDVVQSSAVNAKVREVSRKFFRKGGTMTVFMNKVEAVINDSRSEEIYARSHQKPAEVAAVSYSRRVESGPRPGGYGRGPSSVQHGAYGYSGAVQSGPGRYFRGHSINQQGGQARYWNETRGRGQNRSSYGRPETVRGNGVRHEPCWRCTSNFHSPEECYAATKTCRRCGTTGHLERACRLSLSIQGAIKAKGFSEDEDQTSPAPKVRKIAAITASEQSLEDNPPESQKPVSVNLPIEKDI